MTTSKNNLPLDSIKLFSLGSIQMRTFHITWLMFFVCFFGWFGLAPLMPTIHPTALVAPGARLADSVSIGPYCIVGEGAVLGERVRLVSHVVIEGLTEIGQDSTVHPFAVLGEIGRASCRERV